MTATHEEVHREHSPDRRRERVNHEERGDRLAHPETEQGHRGERAEPALRYRLDEIAAMLEVAYETTRKHLKQIFGKTGTGRQADLVRMVMLGPGGLIP